MYLQRCVHAGTSKSAYVIDEFADTNIFVFCHTVLSVFILLLIYPCCLICSYSCMPEMEHDFRYYCVPSDMQQLNARKNGFIQAPQELNPTDLSCDISVGNEALTEYLIGH